ncbi:MAG: AMP-binding protein [Bacteroidetes bacterium]|nr:AMP-binding protein [Bacteroidota bacterium]
MQNELNNISNLFFRHASVQPDAMALHDGAQTRTYGEFATEVRATAAYLTQIGIQKGDRVLVFVPMGLDLYRVVMALFQIGATAVFLDEWVSLARLRLCCKLADCKAFIAPWQFRWIGFFIPEIRKIPLKPGLGFSRKQTLETLCACDPDDTALITFTTGSTGIPKAARRSHAFLGNQFQVLAEKMNPKPGAVVMTTLPIVLLINFGTGASSVVARFSPKKARRLKVDVHLQEIEAYGVDTIIASPYFMIKLAMGAEKKHFPRLKKIFTGGGPVFPEEAALIQQTFPEANVYIVYGSTEAEPISSIEAPELMRRNNLSDWGGLCVGTPDSNTELAIIRITSDALYHTPLADLLQPEGALGEIVVAGKHVLSSYYNNPEALKQQKIATPEGKMWHRTGDAGFMGSDGQLYLCGRCKEMIWYENQWIAPFIWESAMQRKGTVLLHDGQLILVLENDVAHNYPETFPFTITRILRVNRIPLDPRHNTKIDYGALRNILKLN